MSKGYLALLATLGAFLAPVSHAQLVGLRSEIGRFVTQIDESSQAVSDAMASFTAEYSSGAAVVADREYDLTSSTDRAQIQSPIAKIRYGFVDNYSNFFTAAGADNTGFFVLEVQFKTPTQYPDIHPSLAGKTVEFIAHGPGPLYNTIYTNSTSPGTANLSNYDSMSRIGGFTCFLKSSRCTSTDGGTSNPTKLCNSTEAINASQAPGMLVNNSNNINLFYYVTGPFALCADQYALRNAMGG